MDPDWFRSELISWIRINSSDPDPTIFFFLQKIVIRKLEIVIIIDSLVCTWHDRKDDEDVLAGGWDCGAELSFW